MRVRSKFMVAFLAMASASAVPASAGAAEASPCKEEYYVCLNNYSYGPDFDENENEAGSIYCAQQYASCVFRNLW